MVTSEREMVQKTEETEFSPGRFTSLQPTYEDTVAPDPEHDWEHEE